MTTFHSQTEEILQMKKRLCSTLALLFATSLSVSADDNAWLSEARQVASSLPPKLMAALQEEISRSGLDGAIPVCRDKSPEMAAATMAQTGWKVKRVSLKPRNETRATPDDWERSALEDFDRRAAAGEPVAQLEKGEPFNNEYRYVKALPVQPLCLGCHGSDAQISPEVKAVLAREYPGDRAIGYATGQIRGAISVRKAMP